MRKKLYHMIRSNYDSVCDSERKQEQKSEEEEEENRLQDRGEGYS